MIKLIATDLDGTLFYPKRRLTLLEKSNQTFLKDFANAGGKVVLVTGRDRRVSMKVKHRLGIDISVVGCNGAFIYENDHFVTSNPIPKNILFDLYMTCKTKFGIVGFLIFDESDEVKIAVTIKHSIVPYLALFFNLFSGAYKEKYLVSEKEVIKSIANGNVFKMMPIFGFSKKSRKKAHEAQLALSEKYKGKLTIVDANIALEVTAANIDKARTLTEYIKTKGILPEEVAVAGDSFNDVTMLKAFPHSFGMANGEKVVLNTASHIISKVSDIRPFVLTEDNKLKP